MKTRTTAYVSGKLRIRTTARVRIGMTGLFHKRPVVHLISEDGTVTVLTDGSDIEFDVDVDIHEGT